MEKNRKPSTNSGWNRILSLLPADWEEQAFEKRAMNYNRQYTPESLLRSIMIYLSSKASLQEAVFLAMLCNVVEATPEAFLNRFRKSGDWLLWLAEQTMKRNLTRISNPTLLNHFRLRIIDATSITPPGNANEYWRLHYSLLYPSNHCSEFHLTSSHVAESFKNFDVQEDDLLLGDRIYAKPSGIAHVVDRGGHVLVRIVPSLFPLRDENGLRINLLARLESLRRGRIRNLDVRLKCGTRMIPGRICALKLSSDDARKAKQRARRSSQRAMNNIRKDTLKTAEYVILFTTLPDWILSARKAVDLYRFRWQAETNFKRAKSLFGLGALPCKEENSVKAWIYGKLLIHFMTRGMVPETGDFSPSGPKSAGRNKSFGLARGKFMEGSHQ